MIEFYNGFLKQLTLWQYKLNSLISGSIRELNDENYITVYASVIGIAFIYGLIHAAGPGHGKALVALYFTKGKQNYKDAFKMGYMISVIHAISALTVTFSIFFIIKTMFRQNFNEFSNSAMTLSAIMIIAVGAYLIFSSFKSRANPHSGKIENSQKSQYAVALSAGIVPCPGVMTIVLFCLVLKKFTLAVLAAIAMSIGMGLTISIVGILSVLFSNKTEKFVNTKGYVLEAFSGILIITLGLLLLLSKV